MEHEVYSSGRKDKKAPAEYISSRFGSRKMQKIDRIEKGIAARFADTLGDSGSLLDMPCGSGRFLETFKGLQRVHAIDINEGMLLEARENAPYANIVFQVGSIKAIPLEPGSVDGAFCMRLLHHVADKAEIRQILSEIHRVSRRWALISFYRKNSFSYWSKKLRGKKISGKPIAVSEMIDLCREVGWTVAEVNKIPSTKQTLLLLRKGGNN